MASTLIRQCELLAPSQFFPWIIQQERHTNILNCVFSETCVNIHKQSLKRSCKGCIIFFFFFHNNCFLITTRVPNRDVNKLEVAVGHFFTAQPSRIQCNDVGMAIALRAHRILYRPVYTDGIESKVCLFFFFRRCPIGISIAPLSH